MKRKHPRYKQGKFRPKHPEKYKGDANNIMYRSGLELKYFNYCDMNSNILEWASEEFFVPYIGLDEKSHRYFVDLWLKVKRKDGKIKEFIAEIKPYEQCFKPKPQKRVTKQYKERIATYLTNRAKWEAAQKFADKNGCKFIILTEKGI